MRRAARTDCNRRNGTSPRVPAKRGSETRYLNKCVTKVLILESNIGRASADDYFRENYENDRRVDSSVFCNRATVPPLRIPSIRGAAFDARESPSAKRSPMSARTICWTIVSISGRCQTFEIAKTTDTRRETRRNRVMNSRPTLPAGNKNTRY